MRICSTSIRQNTVSIEEIGVANCNDQIAARAFGAVEHVSPVDFERLKSYDLVYATQWKVLHREIESKWMNVLHRLKDETQTKVVLFQEAETPWPTTRPWEEQKSFIELLGKVDLFLTHNQRDIDLWGALRKGKPSFRWRTCLDLTLPLACAVLPSDKPTRPVLFGSSYDDRANGLTGLIACKDLGQPLWHQNRSTGYEDRNEELPEVLGVTIDREIPHARWERWIKGVCGTYLAVHPMPAASAGRDQIAFAAMGIPCIGSFDLDIQRELFPTLLVRCWDIPEMRRMARWLLDDLKEYSYVRKFAMDRARNYDLTAATTQALDIKRRMAWE